MPNQCRWCMAWFEASTAAGSDRQGLWLQARWPATDPITISFLEGDTSLHQRVAAVARQWIGPERANLRFDFRTDTNDTNIRISFKPPGSWSVLGTGCKRIPAPQPTMNFGWLSADSPDEVLEPVVLHEFGHALGLVHEHQVPLGGIQWNRQQVYADLRPRWTDEQIDRNVIEPVAADGAALSTMDPTSIMMYPIKEAWTLDGFSTGLNRRLSKRDIAFVRNIYP